MTAESFAPPRSRFGSLGFLAVLLILAVGVAFAYRWLHKDDLRKNERHASASLKTLASAEATFRVKDSDGNGVKDYWTGDISGLWHHGQLISKDLAGADIEPLNPVASGPIPHHGYYFVALKVDRGTDPPKVYREGADDAGVKVYNRLRFGFCAYPARYGSTGNWTFFINEYNTVFKVQNGGKPLEDWPTDQDLAGDWGMKGD